jgi:phosphatidylglycerophosphatase C
VALFDLDGTLTWRDTLLPFLAGYLARHPARWLRLWQLPVAIWRYAVSDRDRGLLKSRIIRLVMGGDSRRSIDAWAETFVGSLERRGSFRSAALTVLEGHRRAGDHLVLLSASPDLYVPRIGALLGFERTLCTQVAWRETAGGARLDGALVTANRRGEEKCRCLTWLRTQYPDLPVVAYGNSDSDLPHLRQADRALLVNGNSAARRAATAAGIAVGDWR